MKKTVKKGWLVQDRDGKMKRAIFFCSRQYVPADDRHSVVRVENISWELLRRTAKKRGVK